MDTYCVMRVNLVGGKYVEGPVNETAKLMAIENWRLHGLPIILMLQDENGEVVVIPRESISYIRYMKRSSHEMA